MSIWSSSARVALVAACACNGLLGIESAVDDRDLDGVADLDDNCPDTSNAQQRDSNANGAGDACDCAPVGLDVDGDGIDDACDDCIGAPEGVDVGGNGVDDGCELCREATGDDRDGDGLDDACDPCLDGPPDDEDDDGVADACDNCPSVANPDQASSRPAPIGDACFVLGDRAAFDPFIEQTVMLPGTVAGWSWAGGALTASASPDSSLTRAVKLSRGASVVVETRVTPSESAGLSLRDQDSAVTCVFTPARNELKLTYVSLFGEPVQYTTSAGVGTPRLQLRLDGGAQCVAIDVDGQVHTVSTALFLGSLGQSDLLLQSGGGTSRFEYLWVTTDAPAR